MDHIKKALPFLKARKEKEEEERSSYFLKNGSLVLEGLIESFGGRYRLPIKSFSAKELIRASKNFSEQVHHMTDNGYTFRGNLEGRPILVKLFNGLGNSDECILNAATRDLVITSQMSHHKNVLKLIGCSFEFKYPAIVYEYAGTELLPKYLGHKNDAKLLSLRSRIKIAKDIANVIGYLHSSFPTPIIYRDLTPNKVIIDQCGVAKLFDFTISISLPPGKLQVEDRVKGTYGYLDPQYVISSIVTQKTDVYGLGMLMLVLFTGETATMKYHEGTGEPVPIRDYIKGCLDNAQFNQIVDPKIFEEENHEPRQNLLAFLDLALRCTEFESFDRPDMLDVAKELLHIEKSVQCC